MPRDKDTVAHELLALRCRRGDRAAWEELIRTYQRPSGYGCVFCGACGSPLPDSDRRKTMVDIPAGLIDEHPGLAVAKHIYVGSKASWDVIGDDAPRYEEMPPRS